MGCCYNIDTSKDHATMIVKANKLNKPNYTTESIKKEVSFSDVIRNESILFANKSNISTSISIKANPKCKFNSYRSFSQDTVKFRLSEIVPTQLPPKTKNFQATENFGAKSCFNLYSLAYNYQSSRNENDSNTSKSFHHKQRLSESSKNNVNINDTTKMILTSNTSPAKKNRYEKYAYLFEASPSKLIQ